VVLSVTDVAIAMEIHNESNQTAGLYPEMFLARTSTGEVLPGMQWVGLNKEGGVSVILKRQQLIAPGDAVTLQLMISPKPHESPIESLRWKD
jgi:hypothetical protein